MKVNLPVSQWLTCKIWCLHQHYALWKCCRYNEFTNAFCREIPWKGLTMVSDNL